MKLNTLKNVYWLYPLYELVEWVKIYFNMKKDKVIIYQMGKVGSSTVYNTIKYMNTSYALYHIHWFSDIGIERAENYFKNSSSQKIPMHIRRSKILKRFINMKNENIKIISITREPVARLISDVFQNIHYYNHEFIDDELLNIKEIQKSIENQLKNFDIHSEYASTWFDVEFSKALDLNIYNYPFNKDIGYVIIKHRNIEILLLRMETMNDVLIDALKEFLDYAQDIKTMNTNIGEEKEFSIEQKFVKNNVKVDEKKLKEIYSSEYVSHFYSNEQVESFIQKWRG